MLSLQKEKENRVHGNFTNKDWRKASNIINPLCTEVMRVIVMSMLTQCRPKCLIVKQFNPGNGLDDGFLVANVASFAGLTPDLRR